MTRTPAPLLAQTHYGFDDAAPGARSCLIAHGLFGSARNWNAIAQRLSASRPVITVDMRNHGHSFWSEDHSYKDMAADLAQVIEAQNAGPVDLLGHSMGGKAAMTLALTRPDLVARLLVADIAPVRYGHSQMHYIDAMRAVDLAQVQRRADAAAQLGAQGVAPELQSFFTQSLDIEAGRWRFNLDALAGNMPDILGFPDLTGDFPGPVLFLSGGTSDYVRPEARPGIKALFPAARFAKLPKAGHWLHAERPREFIAAASAFFDLPEP